MSDDVIVVKLQSKMGRRTRRLLTHFDNGYSKNFQICIFIAVAYWCFKNQIEREEKMSSKPGEAWWIQNLPRSCYSLSLKCFLKCAGHRLPSVGNHLSGPGNFHQWAPDRAPWPARPLLASTAPQPPPGSIFLQRCESANLPHRPQLFHCLCASPGDLGRHSFPAELAPLPPQALLTLT